jgi:hypothetical protein
MRRFAPVFILGFAFILIFSPTATRADPLIDGCQVFPLDNPWNADISGAAVHPDSDDIIDYIMNHGGDNVHPDFGENLAYGIPYITVSGTQPKVPVTFEYDDESDPGPYPFPSNAPVEGGGDRHVIVIDRDNCVLYETFASYYVGRSQNAWEAGSGAIYNLNSNAQRPDTWTSADAAGLPIFPGLARCLEAMSGEINHAFRFTVGTTKSAYIYPATHEASSNNDAYAPPLGLRLRLKAGYSLAGAGDQSLAIAEALKKYGMILADNGSNWYISGERDLDNCWDDDDLNWLKGIPGTAFEVIVSPPPATVVLPAPSLSTPVNGESTTNTQPTLIWNTVTSTTVYEILLDRTDPPTAIVATISSRDPTTYRPVSPLLNVPYYWCVRAISGATTTACSPVRQINITSGANAAPSRNLVLNTNTTTLTWNRITGATSYEVQLDNESTFAGATLIHAGTNTFQPVTLGVGRYFWRVHARVGGTWGSWSASESFTVAP